MAKVLEGPDVRCSAVVVVVVATVAVAANSLASREGGWPATRVEENIGRSSFESHRRLFAIG